MSNGFWALLWELIQLRYRLIWAQARTSNGKIIMLFALYMLGASAALTMAFSGIGTAFSGSTFDNGDFIVRWMLTVFFINGFCLSVMFGVGTQAAFSDESLRRYPLNARERFTVRMIIGLLDPIWVILTIGVLGLVIGFVWFGRGLLITGLPAAILFVASSYLATAVALSLIGVVMRSRAGAALIGIIVLLLVTLGPLAISLLVVSEGYAFWKLIDHVIRILPSGAAAALITGDTLGMVLGNAILLVSWCVLLAWGVKKLEDIPLVTEGTNAVRIGWDDFYDQIGGLFGHQHAPMVSKSLRYQLRCNLIRFSLITTPLLVLAGKSFVPSRTARGEVVITLALFFITSAATGVAMMFNLFGFDRAGIRRYAMMPASFVTGLRASSYASLLLRAATMMAALALWVVLAKTQFNLRLFLVISGIVIGSLFLFNALGLWTSVLAPKAANFDSMWNNRLSVGANAVMIGGVIVPYVIAIALAESLDPVVMWRFWWLALLAPALSIGFYIFSLRAIEPVLNSHREQLINQIAGARDN
jgi:hypothetical protein